jgi:signal transduction histidine kinase
MKSCWILLYFLIYALNLHAQTDLTDSLRKVLWASPDDTIKLKRLNLATVYFPFNQPDSGLYYADSIIRLAEKLDYPYGLAMGYFKKGYSYLHKGDYSKAMFYAHESLRIHEALEDFNVLSPAYIVLIGVYDELGDHKKALEFKLKKKEFLISRGDSVYNRFSDGFDSTAFNIAVQDYDIAHSYLAMGMFDSALIYGKEAFSYLQNRWSAIPVLMGDIYSARGDYQTALKYYYIETEIRQPLDSAKNFIGRASVFKKIGHEDSSRLYAELGLDLSRKFNYPKGIMQASEILSHVYEKTNPNESINYLRLSISIKDSLNNKERISQANSIDFNDELRRLDAIAVEKAARNRYKIWALAGGIFTLLVAGFLLWRNNQQKKKANKLLEEEKQTVEQTLEKLKATQAQLIQSEKMASLGELTAGIAHEIQNPLNFVNNFSEVCNELVDEMKTEFMNDNKEAAFSIANDVKQNLEKILHHGKRADSIVKGMLQHSRIGSAEKEMTNINKLADEYLRLAYHGLRAKDKSFNTSIDTNFDETIPEISIFPQDIGRVILNLITNACFAVNEKSKQNVAGYEPRVLVSTKSVKLPSGNFGVEVSVKDNGNGIPEKTLDKIFQPFFTTKPAGQGTGLGLSLSYDIIKAHGGELKVKSKVGEGAEFVFQLPGDIVE